MLGCQKFWIKCKNIEIIVNFSFQLYIIIFLNYLCKIQINPKTKCIPNPVWDIHVQVACKKKKKNCCSFHSLHCISCHQRFLNIHVLFMVNGILMLCNVHISAPDWQNLKLVHTIIQWDLFPVICSFFSFHNYLA